MSKSKLSADAIEVIYAFAFPLSYIMLAFGWRWTVLARGRETNVTALCSGITDARQRCQQQFRCQSVLRQLPVLQ